MWQKVLIANRGEIAVRITQTLQAMGLRVVAIYTPMDADALHVRVADEAWPLAGNTLKETYLNPAQIIQIAKQAGAQAIHPGYGFLSENAPFAQACADAGLVFIGPSPDVIEAMGDKIIAKQKMTEAGVPVVPGWTGEVSSTKAIEKAAKSIGYPVLVKAAAGGGGKGMRLVSSPAELLSAVEGAAREAEKAFGDARVFIEKYIESPRHIEFQIFGDAHGHVIHLGERECSIQRRHQKIVEESPSPFVTPELREAMGQAAIQAAKTLGYTNAGTVEFIVAPDQTFYFLEVNTRLQVEHPVTECVTGLDLVRLQVEIAQGKPLPLTQSQISQRGHAIECRIYAEDPSNGFLPATGTLNVWNEPKGPGIRVDSGVEQGDSVGVHFDPMLAKLITWDSSRSQAIEKMSWALRRLAVLGVTTNTALLQGILDHPEFRQGETDTHFLQRLSPESLISEPSEAIVMDALPLATFAPPSQTNQTAVSETSTLWKQAGLWRNA